MKLEKLAGATSEIWQVFIRDSSSTTGAGLTGLVFNSSSLTAYYHRDTDTTATVISLVTMTVGTFTSSGFKEIDSTNMPGWYQFCPPNAAIASGAKSCAFHLKGATNMAPLPIEVQLVAYDPDNATSLGLSRIDVATSTRLAPTVAARTLDVTANGNAGIDWSNIDFPTSTANLSGTSTQALQPTTAGRTLDVTATGAAGIDWANVENQATAVNLSNTSINGVNLVGVVGSVAGDVGGSVLGDVAGNIGGNISGNLFGTVFGEVAVLSINSIAEPSGAPAASDTLSTKISFIYEALRNKITVDGTSKKFYADAGTLQWSKALSDDGTTFTEAEGA